MGEIIQRVYINIMIIIQDCFEMDNDLLTLYLMLRLFWSLESFFILC